MSAFERKLKEKPSDAAEFKEETVEGATAWHLVPLSEESAKDMKDNNVDLYVAGLDNQLAIAATSRDALVRQIRLYRTGEMKGATLRGFPSAGTVAGLFMAGIGEVMRQAVPSEQLEGVNAAIPNGKQILYGMKTIAFEIKSAAGSDIHLSLQFGMASEADADVLRTMAKTGVMVGRAQLAQSAEQAGGLLKVLDGVKVGGVDGVLELSLDSTVSDLTEALSKIITEMQKSKAGGPRGAGREGNGRRRRRTNAVTDGDAMK